MTALRPCPCGQTPAQLYVTGNDDAAKPKWAQAAGTCCRMWEIEFRNGYLTLGSEASNAVAARAWNEAPRGNQT